LDHEEEAGEDRRVRCPLSDDCDNSGDREEGVSSFGSVCSAKDGTGSSATALGGALREMCSTLGRVVSRLDNDVSIKGRFELTHQDRDLNVPKG
jgi:hypothetical protein